MRYFKPVFALMLWMTSVSSHAKEAMPSSISQPEMFRVFGGLILVLLLIVVLSWLVKRMNPRMMAISNKGFQTIAVMGLGPKERLLVVKAGVNYLLIAQGASSINLLMDYGTQLPEGFEIQAKSSFSDVMKSALGKKES